MIRSLYLTTEEDALLSAFAEEYGASVNFTVRAAVRLLVGLPVPRGLGVAAPVGEPPYKFVGECPACGVRIETTSWPATSS